MKQTESTPARWFHQAIAWVKEGSQANETRGPVHERRRHKRERIPFGAVLTVSNRSFPTQGLDLHKHGAAVLSPIPISEGSVVFIHLKPKGLVGYGHVRHCRPEGKQRFTIGLEFPTELMRKEQGAWRYQRIEAS